MLKRDMLLNMRLLLGLTAFICHCSWTKASTAECPHPEDNYPCYCEEDGDRSNMHCNYLSESKQFEQALSKLKGYKISLVSVHAYGKDTIKSNAFKGPDISEIVFTNSTLAMENPQFVGQESFLGRISLTACYDDVKLMKSWSLGHLQNLKEISFVNNFINVLDNDWITSSGPSLRSVTFDKCRIESLGDQVFSKMTKLTTIFLTNNHISSISRSMFPNPAENLRSINMNDNGITSFPDDIFRDMSSLRVLELERNNIKTLSESSWGLIIEELSRVYLEGNPIRCDSNLKWISKKALPKTFTGHCSEPAKLKNKTLRNLMPADFH